MDLIEKARWGSHEFTVYGENGATWRDLGGLFIFASRTPGNLWKAHYIGSTASFLKSPPSPARWEQAKTCGATHLHAMTVVLDRTRAEIERELIDAHHPSLNAAPP